MKKEELVSGLLWDLSPHGRLSMRAGRQYIKKKKNKNDADDDEKEVDICGGDNYYDDRDVFIKDVHLGIGLFITSGCENKASGLTANSNLDYTESFSLFGLGKPMSRAFSSSLLRLSLLSQNTKKWQIEK